MRPRKVLAQSITDAKDVLAHCVDETHSFRDELMREC